MNKKTRITITLDKNILRRIDTLIDGKEVRNRSHAIESLISQTLQPKLSQAVILAAGKGVRWRPLTYEIPKALIPINGKPILEHTILYLKNYGIKDIVIVIGTLGDKIQGYFGDGKRFGVKITYVEDVQEKGTAAALKSVEKVLQKKPFLVWYIDEIADIDLDDLIQFHIDNDALATVALSSVSDPLGLGTVKLQGSRITAFSEKPIKRKIDSYVVNAGIFVFDPVIFKFLKKNIISLEKEVFPQLVSEKKIYGYLFSGKWFDIGTPQAYAQALKEWRKK